MVDWDRVQDEYAAVKERYPDLLLLKDFTGIWKIVGNLHFNGNNGTVEIEDEYFVEIIIPENYPIDLPSVKELGGRIPKGFHRYTDGTLCLGTPLALKMRFHQNPTLRGFIENCLVEYLYGYSYKLDHNQLPFGEFSHGTQGIIEHYQDLFKTEKLQILLRMLEILANENYRGHNLCPCGSGEKLRKCHGKILLGLMEYQTPQDFSRDLTQIKTLKKTYHLNKQGETKRN
jgi:hypothetical protein